MANTFKDEYEFPDEVDATKVADDQELESKPAKLEIEIEDDTPPEDRGRKPAATPPEDPTEDELASYDEKVQARIKKFTKGFHDERRAKEQALREREAAEQFARQVYEENKKLQQQLSVGSQAFIEQSKTAAETELAMAERQFKEAYEAADSDGMAQAQKAIAKATMRLEQAGTMKPIEVKEREVPAAAPTQTAPRLSSRTQEWVDENSTWFGRPGYDDMTMMAMGLDKKLLQEYGPEYIGTDEYFRTIDRTMRKRFPDFFGSEGGSEGARKSSTPADEEEPPRRATRSSTVVAPAARSTPPNRVRLKASEVATAKRLGVPLEEYAKQVALLRKGE